MTFDFSSKGRQALAMLILTAMCLGAALTTNANGGTQKTDGKDGVQVFQGDWDVAKASLEGQDIPEDVLKDVKVNFKGDQLAMTVLGTDVKATIKVDATKKPQEIEIDFGKETPQKFGIFEVQGDTIKIHATEKKEQRPKDFKAEASFVIIIKRAAAKVDKSDKADKADKKKSSGPRASLTFAPNPAQEKADKSGPQGKWSIASGTKGGMELPPEMVGKIKIEFRADKFLVEMVDEGQSKEGTFKAEDKAKPRQIDITFDGKTVVGIYEVTGDTLKLCLSDEGQARPTDFKPGSGALANLVFKRDKANDTPKGDLEALAGIWKLLEARGDGEHAPPELVGPIRMTFGVDGTLDVQGSPAASKGAFKIDPTTQPKQITLIMPDKQSPAHGIYKLDGAKLVLCFAESAKALARPTEFTADKGSNQIVFVLQQTQTAAEIAREKVERHEGAGRNLSANNLRQLGIAMHTYLDDMKGFPAHAIYSKDGKTPLLSWRVAILPYVDHNDLYKEFKLDEPWDSEHNKKLIPKMPKMYFPAVPGNGAEGQTYYLVFTGKDSLFDGAKKAAIGNIADGMSNTILIVEAKNPVIWTKPEDLELPNAGGKMPELGGMFTTGMNILLCDGSVRWVPRDLDSAQLRAFVTPAGGEVVDFDKLTQMKKKD